VFDASCTKVEASKEGDACRSTMQHYYPRPLCLSFPLAHLFHVSQVRRILCLTLGPSVESTRSKGGSRGVLHYLQCTL
jgi:hypothetical protein